MRFGTQTAAVMFHDLCMVIFAWQLAWFACFDFSMPPTAFWEADLQALPFVIIIQCFINWQLGLYKGLWRFASLPDLWNIVRAAGLGVIAIVLISFVTTRLDNFPRSLLIFYPVCLLFLLSGPRLGYRFWKDHTLSLKSISGVERVLVIGAGRAGETMVRDLLRDSNYIAVGFVDDNPRLHKRKIQGIPVLGGLGSLERIVEESAIDSLLIAVPSATKAQIKKIITLCEKTGRPFQMLPMITTDSAGEIYKQSLSDVREVSIDDLLGRDKIELDWSIIRKGIAGKRVLVTGGGGSIGSELCRQIAKLNPASIMIFEQGEFNLYDIDRTLRLEFPDLLLESRLGDVHDMVSIDAAFKSFRPDVVFHTAAYKHVPMLQGQVREALRNNVLGTRVVAYAADKYECEKFVLISTDKAVNPTSIMGASKRIAEMMCEAKNTVSKTRYITVRFGNVLGSAGSVVPLFQQQIAAGGPVTVTHKEMTRFFMTIPEACQLILQSGSMGEGGEIFVLDMGEPISILYLAEQMIKLSWKKPGQDIEIKFTGLRKGEKLSEELFHHDEDLVGTGHEKILLAKQRFEDWPEFEKMIEQIETACGIYNEEKALKVVQQLVPELVHDPIQKEEQVELHPITEAHSNIIAFEKN
ncbi:MAG: polysaccharide biosynthesis protein [Gammaproteobacteria bacterium]